jgi:predicted enzyme related to lactoylglutathione lyase
MHTGSKTEKDEKISMKLMKMIPPKLLRKIYVVLPLIFLPLTFFAESPPAKILYVGAISIDPCQDAKALADWYSRFGIETREYRGGYYGKFETAAGMFVFGIHPKKADAPEKCSAGVSVVYRVENFGRSLLALKAKGLVPEKTEKDQQGQFAHFHDPDGNEVTIWGE